MSTLEETPSRIRRGFLWWQARNRRYGWWWRSANIVGAVLILVTAAVPTLEQVFQSKQYKLSAEALHLVGKTDPTLAKQLTYDTQIATYQFNKDAVKSYNPLDQLKSQAGTANGTSDKSLYSVDVPQDISKGVTYHDINSQLSFSLIP